MRSVFPLVLFITALLAFVGCNRQDGTEAPSDLRKITFQSDWFPQAEHGGFYQALAKGYYEEAGLDLTILSGGPSAGVLLKIAKGDADFGMFRADDVILAASRGLPLMMIGVTLQHDPQAILVHADSPIQSFADLQGHTVIAAVGMTWIPYIKKKYDITFGLVPTNYGLVQFLADKTAIQQCFLTSEPYFAQQKGATVRTLPLSETGYDSYHAMLTNKQMVRENPEVVRAFVQASVRGWRDYLEGDPAPAHDLIMARNPQMSAAQLNYSRNALIEHGLAAGDPEKGEQMGQLLLERVQREIELLREFQVLEKPMQAAEVATNEFLSAENH